MTPTFDVTGPLPRGLTVLEASAGTGKTYAVAALVARYVAEGIPLDQLLVVTFTRMATGELRARVRERLVTAEAGLQRGVDGPSGRERGSGAGSNPDDAVLDLLAAAHPATVERRRRRLAAALADFDAATIATTHGFCEHVLAGLGVLGDVERDVTLVEDTRDLVEEVVDDLYVRRVLRYGPPGFSRAEAGQIAAAAMASPDTPLAPERVPAGSEWELRLRLAKSVRRHVEERKRRAKLMTYDDLLSRLANTLADGQRGALACARLRDRYRVALVDEFQDTDPVQWEILRRAFGDGTSTLVLIGDPKQAIYNFRGADVYAYLDAASSAGATATLGTNWRSDQGLVDATQALFGNSRLGHPDISFRAVAAAAAHRSPGLRGPHPVPPLRIRMLPRHRGDVELTTKGYVAKVAGEQRVAEDLAADVVRLLDSDTKVVARDDDGGELGGSRVRPGDVAVLVRTNRQAARVRDTLERTGVPAVVSGAGSVFATTVAQDWLRLLEALERPASTARIRTVALTSFVGWSAAKLAAAGDDEIERLQAEVHGWAALLERRGVASLLEAVSRSRALAARLLTRSVGERQLTDLRHIGQLLHGEAAAGALGATALASWLRRRIAEAGTEGATEERSRRLESDAEAVQVLTIHRSKGLEFAVTYVPYLWTDQSVHHALPVFHDPADHHHRKVHVAGKPELEAHTKLRDAEERGEDLRLAYVALTRARHSVVCWWAASWDSRISPLGRLLFGRADDGSVTDGLKKPPADAEARARLDALAAASGGTIAVEETGCGPPAPWSTGQGAASALDVCRFERHLDTLWRRTSYTAITAGSHVSGGDRSVGTEAVGGGVSDEVMPADAAMTPLRPPEGEPGPAWAAIPSGARTGTLVHAVLERTDFAADDLGRHLETRVEEELVRLGVDDVAPGDLHQALSAVIDTPLGPLADDLPLRRVAARDRLDELDFELPLAGGDRPAGEVGVDAIAALLRRRLPAGDPLAGYADLLGGPVFDQGLRGFLTGSIDLVLRLGGARFLVVDYKTNRLDGDGPRWYRPAALAQAMQQAHYPLQALLYAVALHRFLRWRLAGYDPDRNLAGVLYLFVRGMIGPSTPRIGEQPCGVFAWRPPSGLVAELSDVLDGTQ